ncbi:MAG TPA: hypothetical protein VKQ52_09780 [Puia sp.]|nr:hypothetical protein [Puia sp.]
MTLEEYEELVLVHLEKARDCGEVERIVARSIAKLRDKHLPSATIAEYVHALRSGLEKLSINDFDPVHWCNIRYAIVCLKNYHL